MDFVYKSTDYYDSTDEGGIVWRCLMLNIAWPYSDVQLSEKDKNYPGLKRTRCLKYLWPVQKAKSNLNSLK